MIIKSISTIIVFVILSTIIVNFAAAQQSTKSIGIKITSPVKGQQISLPDNDLKISGITAHNGSLTCNVYIIVNDIKPYQKALPTGGHNNIKDYSTWIYNLVPSYTTIKTGTNKITSKLACQDNNAKTSNTSLTQYYGINVTGTAQSLKKSNSNMSNNNLNNKKQTSIEKKNIPISNDHIKILGSPHTNSQPVTLLSTAGILSLSTPRADKHSDLTTNADIAHSKDTNSKSSLGLTLSATSKTGDINLNNNGSTESAKQQSNTSTVGKPEKTSFGSNHSNNNTKSLSVSMHLAKGPIHVGNKENLTLGVTDSNSTHAIAGAAILGKITNPSGISNKLEGTTDGKGKVSYSWQISRDITIGKYKVVMEASAPGYENNSVSKTFTVLPIRNISSNNDNTVSSDLYNINNNPSNANSRPVITTLLPKTYNNLNSPLIFSKQNPPHLALQSRVYIPSANSLSYENSRVYIPSSGHTYNNNNNNNMMSTYNKVGIPSPNTNSTIEQGVNPIQKPFEQGVNPIQKPQLPNNQEPFVMATPLLHINNGTSLPASHQLSSTAIAMDLVDRMRVIGFDSGMSGSPSKLSVSSASTSIPQKSTVFIPTVK
ncbi:MAG: hypothetical protein WAJ93_09660 [Candidatus Nitrosopolaris sp.]